MNLAKILLSVSIIFSSFLMATPVEAQTSYQLPFLCLNLAGNVAWPQPNTSPVTNSSTCPQNYQKSVPQDTISSIARKVCVAEFPAFNPNDVYKIYTAFDTNGAEFATCPVPANAIRSTKEVISNPPSSTPPTTTLPTNPPTKPPTQPPTGGGTTTPGDPGNCGAGFTAKGPLCIPDNPFSGSSGVAGSGSLGQLATTIISVLLGLAGMVAVIFVIIGGYYYMTAAGNDSRATSGRKTLVNALIGLAIVVLSFLIVQIVTNFITS